MSTTTFTITARTDDDRPAPASHPTLDELQALAEVRRATQARIDELAVIAHDHERQPWAAVGRAVGVSEKSAQRRYSPKGQAEQRANAEAMRANRAAWRRSHEVLTSILTQGGMPTAAA